MFPAIAGPSEGHIEAVVGLPCKVTAAVADAGGQDDDVLFLNKLHVTRHTDLTAVLTAHGAKCSPDCAVQY
jgi:hypothetical protein